jgi:Ni/Co efflux regulator RcnB
MKTSLIALAATLAATTFAVPAVAQNRGDQTRWEQAQRRFENERSMYEAERERYEAARRRYGGYNNRYNNGAAAGAGAYRDDYSQYRTDYDATQYYRDDPRYQERVLTANDEVYRGSDGRYYCRRNDGTTGLIIGGAGGALFGNMIDGGRNRVGGTLIGGALGALLGRSVEQNSQPVRCR